MPTKRRSIMRGRDVLSLAALSGWEALALGVGWSPPWPWAQHQQGRWSTWADFFADYAMLRGEFLASGGFGGDASSSFAERIWSQTDDGNPVLVGYLQRETDAEHARVYNRWPAHLRPAWPGRPTM